MAICDSVWGLEGNFATHGILFGRIAFSIHHYIAPFIYHSTFSLFIVADYCNTDLRYLVLFISDVYVL